MGVSGQGEQHLSPKTQKNDNDNAIRKRINKRYIFPVDEVTVSVDEETGKSVFIDKRELGMSVPGFWGPQTQQVACPPLTVWTRPIE